MRAQADRLLLFAAVAAVAVLAWRAVALIQRGVDRDILDVGLAGVGATFVGCALVVAWAGTGAVRKPLAAFLLCAGLHWGGPIELAPGPWRAATIYFYLVVSGLLAQALLLQFAWTFARPAPGPRRPALVALYAPVVVAAATAAIAVVATGAVRESAQSTLLAIHGIVTNLYGLLVVTVFVARLASKRIPAAHKPCVALALVGVLVAWSPYLLVSAAGYDAEAWNLSMVALPIALTVALLRSPDRTREEA